jgi:hypothetical protein
MATKIKFVGNIGSTQCAEGKVTFKFSIPEDDGNVATTNISAKPASTEGSFTIKKIAAQDIKLGARIKIEVTVIDPSEYELEYE